MAIASVKRGSFRIYLQLFVLLTSFASFCDAGVSCDSDQFCQDLYNTADTVCLSTTKECSNPFQKGCLRAKGIKGYSEKVRVCTSADESATSTKTNSSSGDDGNDEIDYCQAPDFPYPEIRIHNADWASSQILAWIYQIVLVEILDVPATVGLTSETAKLNGFYSTNNTLEYSQEAYPWGALQKANEKMFSGNNCENTNDPCVHIFPEVWNGQIDQWQNSENTGVIDQTSSNGIVFKPSLMIPKKTAGEFPSLSLFYGLQGDQNRRVLAEMFKKPTSWVDYCETVSLNNCSAPDSTAARYPAQDEKLLYFLEGSYTGYFLATDKNNCVASDNLDDCHGYLVGPTCNFSAYIDSQIYWNDIGLKLDGPVGSRSSYLYKSMLEIWKAANATGSHVMMWWWTTSIEAQAFGNSSYSPQMIQLPQPSLQCLANRPTLAERCSDNPVERRGNPLGACDQEYTPLQRVMASSVNQMNALVPEVDRSPAVGMLTALQVSEFDIVDIIQKMLADGEDQIENNAREAVCDWVAGHIDELEEIIPPNFPKRLTRVFEFGDLHYVAQAMAGLVGLSTLACIFLTYKYRETKTMIFAQPTFIQLILIGFCLVCVAAFMLAVVPRDQICLSIKWLEVLGLTIQLVPIMIKTAALNQLISSSKKQQMVNINQRSLLRKVTMWMAVVVSCLIAWTVTDPPKVAEYRSPSRDDPSEVIIDRECKSEELGWEIVQSSMELVLLFICAILAFQSRKLASVVNESRVLAQLIYSHFLFVILRVLVTAFDLLDLFSGDIIPILASFNHSFDTLFAMCIYILPKIIKAMYEPEKYIPKVTTESPSTRGLKKDPSLKVLICTANMGNAAPTKESMENWIPTDGACFHVTPLAGAAKELKKGYFDIIVIGMQESTWARNNAKGSVRKEVKKEEKLSEEDILNALDQHDSAALRMMVHDIVGSEYTQIVEELRGQMRLSIWASVNIEQDINSVKISGANTGIGNVLANKGGIVATIDYKTTRLTFISAHLAAHEGENYYKNRLQNIRSILKEGKTSDLSSKLDVTMTSHHMFLLGDLNFRTKFEDEDLPHEECVNRAMSLVDFKDYEGLYMYDELQKGLKDGDLLHNFETLPCNFPPTFKLEREPGFVYKSQRTPSYTDRIVFKSADGFRSHVKPLAYEPCADFVTSDHKPIRGAFALLPSGEARARIVPGKLILKMAQIEASNLPVADASGKADPYLMLMWEGVDLMPHNMSFRDKLRRYYNGQFWPRTSYRSRTLDPVWDEDLIHVEAETPMVRKGSFLYVVVVDHDRVGKDDFMCGTTLSLWDLCQEGTKTHDMDIPLTKDGTLCGRVKFKLYIGFPQGRNPTRASARRGSVNLTRIKNFFDVSHRDEDDEDFYPVPHNQGHLSSSDRAKSALIPTEKWRAEQTEKQSREVLTSMFGNGTRPPQKNIVK
ncbi:unnamed protein product [Cylindrotheca closterium]|uniref:C2 domain-containing protein n=1 Tax=Cylindrotheca closterium TaxID=2856 RepID=A0AAD2CG86_9STRA|nr:unnamed protein product [Cylindrotheca closterium]